MSDETKREQCCGRDPFVTSGGRIIACRECEILVSHPEPYIAARIWDTVALDERFRRGESQPAMPRMELRRCLCGAHAETFEDLGNCGIVQCSDPDCAVNITARTQAEADYMWDAVMSVNHAKYESCDKCPDFITMQNATGCIPMRRKVTGPEYPPIWCPTRKSEDIHE